VDNGSGDGTLDFVKNNYLQVILIENKRNLGACKARNQGIEASKGEWILTLDCDIVLEKDFFSKIMEFAEASDKSIGMFQPKILNMDKKIVYSCGIYLSRLRRFYDIGKNKLDVGQFGSPNYIFGACSAAALYKRQMLEEVRGDCGYFDERFFFLVEDVDLSWRMQRIGWKAMFYPAAVCYHFGNSSNYEIKIRQYLCFRNRYLMISKEENLLGKLKLFSLSLWYEIPRAIYLLFTNKYLRHGSLTFLN
jgi:hypothetical protein